MSLIKFNQELNDLSVAHIEALTFQGVLGLNRQVHRSTLRIENWDYDVILAGLGVPRI